MNERFATNPRKKRHFVANARAVELVYPRADAGCLGRVIGEVALAISGQVTAWAVPRCFARRVRWCRRGTARLRRQRGLRQGRREDVAFVPEGRSVSGDERLRLRPRVRADPRG